MSHRIPTVSYTHLAACYGAVRGPQPVQSGHRFGDRRRGDPVSYTHLKRAGKSSEKLQIEKLYEKFAGQVADLTKQLVNKLYTLLQGKTTTGITDYFGVELYPCLLYTSRCV